MIVNKLAISLLIINILITPNKAVAEEMIFDEWIYVSTEKFSKASTKNEAGSEFGIICADKCFYYINSGITCLNNKKYLVMMSTEHIAKALNMNCVLRSENYFQILDEFNDVKLATDKSQNISFISSLENGTISASFFGLKGAKEAINKTIGIARKNKYPKPIQMHN